jgi:hypothetical protein
MLYPFAKIFVRRQNLVDLKLPELRKTLAHQVVLMLITVMHLLAKRQGLLLSEFSLGKSTIITCALYAN